MYIEEISEILKEEFLKNGYDVPAFAAKSNRPELCDLQCNDIFKVAKTYGKNPIELGKQIVASINERKDFNNYFEKVEFVKPGFINISLSLTFINKYLLSFNEDIKNSISQKKSETIVIDYGGPNVAKPLHVGHMRTTNIGESIRRILKFYGNNVISDVHLGDIGLQVGQVIYAVIKDNLSLDEITIDYLDLTYPKMSAACKEDEDLKNECATITKELQDGNEKYYSIWKKICEISVSDMKKTYSFLGSNFDYWYGESDALKYVDETTEVLKPVLEESEGAVVIDVNSEGESEMPPLIYIKSNGAYLYGTTDLATIYQRRKDFDVDRIVYVTDYRQNMHFKQVFRAAYKGNLIKENSLEHIGYGTANGEDNKPYKTRGGKTPRLEDLLNDTKKIFVAKREENQNLKEEDVSKIAKAILKFADLQTAYEKDYIFDLNKFSEVNGKTGPYIIYTYLRINKIIKEFDVQNELSNTSVNLYDRNLRIKLLELGKLLDLAYEERRPNFICDYLYNLCSEANIFYSNNHLTKEKNKVIQNDWLVLFTLTNKCIETLLDLLAIEIPNEM